MGAKRIRKGPMGSKVNIVSLGDYAPLTEKSENVRHVTAVAGSYKRTSTQVELDCWLEADLTNTEGQHQIYMELPTPTDFSAGVDMLEVWDVEFQGGVLADPVSDRLLLMFWSAEEKAVLKFKALYQII